MKKLGFLKYLILIPIYVVLIALQNIRVCYINMKEGVPLLSNIDKFNLNIAIIMGVSLLILILYKKLKENKKILFSVSFVLISCSLLNGIFWNKNVLGFSLVYLYLVFMSYVVSNIFKQRFEISLFSFVSSILLIFVILGMLNMLSIIKYFVLVSTLLGVIYIVYNLTKSRGKEKLNTTLKRFNEIGIVIFSILFVIFVMGGVNRYVHTWDEYSHWGFDAKAVIHYNKLSNCEEVMSSTRAYPPVLTLFNYFINIFIGMFVEHNLYIGLSIFCLVFCMPILSIINKKEKIVLPLYVLCITLCGMLFGSIYKYNTLYADLPFAIVTASAFAIYIIFKDDNKKLMRYLSFPLLIAILTKPTGIIPVCGLLLIFGLIDYMKLRKDKFVFKEFLLNIFEIIKKWWKLALVIVIVFVSWFLYAKIADGLNEHYYDAKIIGETLETGLSYKLNSKTLYNVAKSLIKSFDQKIIYGKINFSLYQYILILFLLLFMVFYLQERGDIKDIIKKIIPFALGYAVFLFLTFLSIFVTFTVYETEILASFTRYLSVFNIAFLMFIMMYIVRDEFLKIGKNRIFTIVFFTIFLINLSFADVTFFISDYQKRLETRETGYKNAVKFEIVNENTEENSRVYVIDQEDKTGIMAMWYARFYSFPRQINAYQTAINWKIRTDKNADDLQDWGLTAEKLEEHLDKYNFDYIYFYTSDAEMFDKMSYMFEDYSDTQKYTLFKIKKIKDGIKLLPVA